MRRKRLTHLSLFTGIGGLDLAAEAAGFETVGQCEFAEYPTKVLEKHWPDVPRWRDIHELSADEFIRRTGLHPGQPTVLSGGFPCQPFSVAGKRRGDQDDRYLWPEMLRIIDELRPDWVVGENVAGIVSMALDTVLSDLEAIGYETQAFIIPACAVDAPHRRDRCAIVGHAEHDGLSADKISGKHYADAGKSEEGPKPTKQLTGASITRSNEVMEYADYERCEAGAKKFFANDTKQFNWGRNETDVSNANNRSGDVWRNRELSAASETERERTNHGGRAAVNGFGEWWKPEPVVGRVANGVPRRVDRLKCLGNAVVPQQFYPIFQAIAEIEQRRCENSDK